MIPLDQILFILIFIMIAQWSTFFLFEMFFSGCMFEDLKDFIIKNSIISVAILGCIMVIYVIGGIIS